MQNSESVKCAVKILAIRSDAARCRGFEAEISAQRRPLLSEDFTAELFCKVELWIGKANDDAPRVVFHSTENSEEPFLLVFPRWLRTLP
jgi:hypothetical protein